MHFFHTLVSFFSNEIQELPFVAQLWNYDRRQLEGRATLHYIGKAGHLVELERPCVYNRHLNKILASLYEDGKQN